MSGPSASPTATSRPMTDPVGRTISYLRVSVTDRCDLRCFYCMSEDMTFLPKADLLTLEELDRLCSAFIAKGVRKLPLTGGEELGERNVMGRERLLATGAVCWRIARLRCPPHQRLAVHPGPFEIPGHHPMGRSRQGFGRHRGRAVGGSRGQGQ